MEYKANEVGIRLRTLRKSGGYSREEIAAGIGRSPKYYADIERGICGMSLDTLISLSDFYHVSLDFLVMGTTEQNPEQLDEETRWAMLRLCQMEKRRRKIVVEMVNLMAEQAQGKEE